MKKSKKSFEELAAEMTTLQETKTGELRGGFSSFGTQSMQSRVVADNNNSEDCAGQTNFHDCAPD